MVGEVIEMTWLCCVMYVVCMVEKSIDAGVI
jgi:hypothetical protein